MNEGDFYVRLGVPNKRKFWVLHLFCLENFLIHLLEGQATKIAELRGYNPLETDWSEVI